MPKLRSKRSVVCKEQNGIQGFGIQTSHPNQRLQDLLDYDPRLWTTVSAITLGPLEA